MILIKYVKQKRIITRVYQELSREKSILLTISVSIPAYNAESTIGKCLEGILCQCHSASEVIIVDDDSSDNTGKMSKKNICRIVRSAHNLGIPNARNIEFNREGHFNG